MFDWWLQIDKKNAKKTFFRRFEYVQDEVVSIFVDKSFEPAIPPHAFFSAEKVDQEALGGEVIIFKIIVDQILVSVLLLEILVKIDQVVECGSDLWS